MMVGTNHFVDEAAAIRYYAKQGIDAEGVRRKIMEDEIRLGQPKKRLGERLTIIDDGTRYAIVEPEQSKPA